MKSIRILQSSENSKIYKTRRCKRGGGEKCVLKMYHIIQNPVKIEKSERSI